MFAADIAIQRLRQQRISQSEFERPE